MTANDFAKPVGSSKKYNFGLDKEKAVETLRRLADSIETGGHLIQDVVVYSKANIEDFTLTTLIMKFAENQEKLKADEKLVNLYGNKQFPVDIASTKRD